MLPVRCPNCAGQFETEEANAGQYVPCPTCGFKSPVPGRRAAREAAATAKPSRKDLAAPTRPQGAATNGLGIVGLVCGIGGLLLGALPGGWTLFALLPAASGLIASALGVRAARHRGVSPLIGVIGLLCSFVALVWIAFRAWFYVKSQGTITAP